MRMIESLSLLALALTIACSHDDDPGHPKPDLTTSKGAASLALETLKKSVDAQNYAAFGFSAPTDANAAKLVELGLSEERLTVDSASRGPTPTISSVSDTLTYAYEGPHGPAGEIVVAKFNNEWRPVLVGASKEMQRINASLAAVRLGGGKPRAIVRVRSLAEVYIRYERNGVSRLSRPQDGATLRDQSLEESLLEVRGRIQTLSPALPAP